MPGPPWFLAFATAGVALLLLFIFTNANSAEDAEKRKRRKAMKEIDPRAHLNDVESRLNAVVTDIGTLHEDIQQAKRSGTPTQPLVRRVLATEDNLMKLLESTDAVTGDEELRALRKQTVLRIQDVLNQVDAVKIFVSAP
eukprot:tig00000025_g7920.t1